MKDKNRSKRHPRLYALFVRPTRNERILFVRYLIPGLTGSIVDLVMLILLTELTFHLAYGSFNQNAILYVVTAIAFVCGVIVNFFLSRRLVFNHMHSRLKSPAGELAGHLLIGLIGLFFTELLILLGTHAGWDYIVSKIIAMLVVFFWNYSARRFILYKKGRRKNHPPRNN